MGTRSYVRELVVCGLLLVACDERREWTYPTFSSQTPDTAPSPSTREPRSARERYENACVPVGTGAGALDGGLSGAAGAGDSGPPTAELGCSGGKVVHFVYFVEADRAYSACWHAALEQHAYAFQRYWYEQFGVTFYLNEPVVDVVMAEHESRWYVTNYDRIHDSTQWYRLGNVMTEVYAKLGIEQFDPDRRVVTYPTTRYDGHVGANFGGAWMDGDNITCLATGLTYPYGDDGPAHCLGHALHELGHVFGLEHTGPESDCMQYGFYTDDPDQLCTFSRDNVVRVLRNADNAGWLEAQPGDRCSGG